MVRVTSSTHRRSSSSKETLIWAQLPVHFIHEFEEYVLPGRFLKWFNRRVLGSIRGDRPMTPLVSLWINIPIIFTTLPIGAIHGRDGPTGRGGRLR